MYEYHFYCELTCTYYVIFACTVLMAEQKLAIEQSQRIARESIITKAVAA